MATKIIIVGANRAEEVVIKPKEFDLRYFDIRGAAYALPPGQLKRMIVTEPGRPTYDDEVLIYPEDGIRPHGGTDGWWDVDTQLRAIDMMKYSDIRRKVIARPKRDRIADLERIGAAIMPIAIAVVIIWSVIL